MNAYYKALNAISRLQKIQRQQKNAQDVHYGRMSILALDECLMKINIGLYRTWPRDIEKMWRKLPYRIEF